MSKAHDPHWRYVAFRVKADQSLGRPAIGNALKGHFRKAGWPEEELPQLTRYVFPHGIVKVLHHRLQDTRDALPTVSFAVDAAAKVAISVQTLSSSGTIKTLTQRIGALQQRDKPKPAKGAPTGGKGRAGGRGAKPPAGKHEPSPPRRRPRTLPSSGPAPPPGGRRR